MTESSGEADVSLPDFLRNRARQSTDTRLALDVAAGFVVALVAVVWRGPGWYLVASAALCFLSYGAWGISDRELVERAATTGTGLSALRAARVVAAILGVASAVFLILATFAVALGSVKS